MVKVIYTRQEVISISKVRQMCINNNFYTKGDCSQYENMFDMCREYNRTQDWDSFILIAQDIYEHSDKVEIEDYGFETACEVIAWIASKLLNCLEMCVTY